MKQHTGNVACERMKDMIIAFIIWTLVAFIFAAIGISSRRSKEPTGFFTGVKPPKIEDVKGYNRAVSKLWFVSAFVYELLGIQLLFLEQNSAGFIPVILGVPIGTIGMVVAYLKIEGKYKKK